jgi:hypothetical protein
VSGGQVEAAGLVGVRSTRSESCAHVAIPHLMLLQCVLHSIDGHNLNGVSSSELRLLIKQV